MKLCVRNSNKEVLEYLGRRIDKDNEYGILKKHGYGDEVPERYRNRSWCYDIRIVVRTLGEDGKCVQGAEWGSVGSDKKSGGDGYRLSLFDLLLQHKVGREDSSIAVSTLLPWLVYIGVVEEVKNMSSLQAVDLPDKQSIRWDWKRVLIVYTLIIT